MAERFDQGGVKERISGAEYIALHRPGIAWSRACDAIKEGNVAEAQRLLAFMVESDRKLMEEKIRTYANRADTKETP